MTTEQAYDDLDEREKKAMHKRIRRFVTGQSKYAKQNLAVDSVANRVGHTLRRREIKRAQADRQRERESREAETGRRKPWHERTTRAGGLENPQR